MRSREYTWLHYPAGTAKSVNEWMNNSPLSTFGHPHHDSRLDQRQGVTVERLGFIPYPREQTAAALRTVAVRAFVVGW